MSRFYDKAKVSTRHKTKGGFLVAEAVLARTGIQEYTPGELITGGVPLPAWLRDRKTIRLNRPPEEVFKDQALKGLEHLPITIHHPSDDVKAQNVKDLQVGFTMSPAKQEGDKAINSIKVQSGDAIAMVEAGMDELSVGYDSEIVFVSGPEEADQLGYEGVQTQIEPNHVALVDRARGGHNVRIMDTGDRTMVTRLIDGISVEFSEQGAQAVDKMAASLKDATEKHATEIAKLNDAISALQGKLDATAKELETEKAARLTDAQIADAVQKKTELVEKAKAFLGDSADLLALSDIEIKKAVVSRVYDGLDLSNRDDVYISAVFDAAVLAKNPSASQQLRDGIEQTKTKVTDGQKAAEGFVNRHARKYAGGKQ